MNCWEPHQRWSVIAALASLLSLFLPAAIQAENENYGWPLQDNYGISATFGEFRDDHFHAGIDFSTNGETGLPVLAIADGKISRIKIQKRAYGKALYIIHSNGITSVYAHLSRYSSVFGIEQLYQAKVHETGTKYPGDIFIDPPISVHKGDIVAFSGETGAGFPHLHMELRRNETLAINPLLNGFKDAMDSNPPTFQAVYLYPLDATSAVDGDLETEEIRLQRSDSYFVGDHLPLVRGNFMASVSVYDGAQRPYHRSPHRIMMSIDHQTVYTVEFDEFSYAQPSYFGLLYDLGKPGSSFYEYPVLLNRLANVTLPFAMGPVRFSTNNLSPGPHQLQVEASDANNNTSIAQISFIVNHPPTIQIRTTAASGQDLIVDARVTDQNWQSGTPQTLAAEVEYSIDEGKHFLPFASTSLQSPAQKQQSDFEYRIPLAELTKSGNERILLKARAFDGVEYSPYSLIALNTKTLQSANTEAPRMEGKLRAITYSNAMKVIFDSLGIMTAPVSLHIANGNQTIPLQAQDLTSYQTVVTPAKASGELVFGIGGHQLNVPVNYVAMGTQAKVSGENFDLLLDRDSLLWDTFVWTKSMSPYKTRYLPLIGPMLQLGPRGLPFNKDAILVFHYPSTLRDTQKLSVYNWNRERQRWTSIPSTLDTGAATVQARIKVLDMYALISDNVAPVINPVFPKRKSTTRNTTPRLAAEIHDAGMGVNDEKIRFLVDNVAYTPDYDPDRDLATLQLNTPLRKGYHKFSVVAYDYAGNETRSPKVLFRVR